jgi:hypothetical protein
MSPRQTASRESGSGTAGLLGVLRLGQFGHLGRFGRLGRILPSGAVGLGVSCALVASTLTPVYAAPVNTAAALRAGTLAGAREAARAGTVQIPWVAPAVLDGQGPVTEQDNVGEGDIRAGEETEIAADGVGAKVPFSGHDIDRDLKVEVKELQDGAGRTAAAETGGVALNSAVEVTATSPDGKDVSSFPADPTIVETENGPDLVTAVDPGVGLELAIDSTKLATGAGLIDPASVRIMTRENPGEAWVELPS